MVDSLVVTILLAILACSKATVYEEIYIDSNAFESHLLTNWLDNSVIYKLGQLSGVGVQNASNFVLLHRADRHWENDSFDNNDVFTKKSLGPISENPIVMIQDGKIKTSHGANFFYLPHSISVDHAGNIWTTDVALHQVFKFAKNDLSKPSLILGEKFVPGSDEGHFCKPTDVAVAKNGLFFVADGYCNRRVMKFSKEGKFIRQWGQDMPGSYGNYSMAIPHSLTLIEKLDTICVADREHERVLCYRAGLEREDVTGNFLFEVAVDGRVFGVASDDSILYVLAGSGGQTPSIVYLFSIQDQSLVSTAPAPSRNGFLVGHAIRSVPADPELELNRGFIVVSLVDHCERDCKFALAEDIKHGKLWRYEVGYASSAFEDVDGKPDFVSFDFEE